MRSNEWTHLTVHADAAKARSRGIIGPALGQLLRGEPVSLPDGSVISDPSEFLGPPPKPLKVVLLGDTCDNSGIAEAATNCDVLVHEVVQGLNRLRDHSHSGGQCTHEASREADAREYGHSTSTMAGAFAHAINARILILTHFR
jgi:ribonuclease Z